MDIKKSEYRTLSKVQETNFQSEDESIRTGNCIISDYSGKIWKVDSSFSGPQKISQRDELDLDALPSVRVYDVEAGSFLLDLPTGKIYYYDKEKMLKEGCIRVKKFFYPFIGVHGTRYLEYPAPLITRYVPDSIFFEEDWWEDSGNFYLWTVKNGVLRKYTSYGEIRRIELPFPKVSEEDEGVQLPHNIIYMRARKCKGIWSEGGCNGLFLFGIPSSRDKAIVYKIPNKGSGEPVTVEYVYPFTEELGEDFGEWYDVFGSDQIPLVQNSNCSVRGFIRNHFYPYHLHSSYDGGVFGIGPGVPGYTFEGNPTWLFMFLGVGNQSRINIGFSTTYFSKFRRWFSQTPSLWMDFFQPPETVGSVRGTGTYTTMIASKKGVYYFPGIGITAASPPVLRMIPRPNYPPDWGGYHVRKITRNEEIKYEEEASNLRSEYSWDAPSIFSEGMDLIHWNLATTDEPSSWRKLGFLYILTGKYVVFPSEPPQLPFFRLLQTKFPPGWESFLPAEKFESAKNVNGDELRKIYALGRAWQLAIKKFPFLKEKSDVLIDISGGYSGQQTGWCRFIIRAYWMYKIFKEIANQRGCWFFPYISHEYARNEFTEIGDLT